ncbi:MAG: tRNA (adenosine(37)-N6)-dimethylallyltransferase MiaA [Clostridiaceae bacterium]|jgi:tRNA dimethylallyltransferase|nr:tRNA (adenosine(37)-N6)-dimethylallyltransferase MiaA [Clostridiaceae bacterium]
MEKVVVIAGPTASGKTELAINVAKETNGEVISADSMQIYKYMNIGTAKPTEDEMQGIPHHMLDVVYPDKSFNVTLYKDMAEGIIRDIIERKKLPIIAGGTGLYINSLIYNIKFSETVSDEAFREKMNRIAVLEGPQKLHDMLKEVDPESAARIHCNNIKRVIRALEVYEFTKKPISQHQKESRNEPPPYRYLVFILNMDRDELYRRIDARVDNMVSQGLTEEVKSLKEMGYSEKLTSMQGLGYKEIFRYLDNKISYEEAINIIKRDTRRYAKRQITWFKSIREAIWLPAGKGNIEKNTKKIIEQLET